MEMNCTKMSPNPGHSLGYTRLGVGFALLLIVFGTLLAVTKFLDLSALTEGSMDQGVIEAVRQGISAYAENAKDKDTASSPYPAMLDEAEIGDATPQNLFFSHVLPKGIAATGWAKTGRYEYRSPSGNSYRYDPREGTFEEPAGNR